ncbi:hypothetical protein IW261DRAFT_1664699 [Armillaria novae-zelandiae]|uniref:Uncharacterized protein n=1 Tax=Armillaria novae-zelandiae TaxID=153914 RepID=A0AA39UNV4_9AGAR|nr:hypothetical protein IW261DRAFT_1664699 [Armillaria novae-zelandiae]
MDDDDGRMLMDDDQWQIIDGEDWWRTSYSAVSWAPSTMTTAKKVAVLPPLTVDEQPAVHDDMDLSLSSSLPGVQAALGALGRYEADVGFYFSQNSEAMSVSDACHCDGMNTGRWNELIADLFGDIPTYASSSSASSRGTPSPCPVSVHVFRRIYYVRTKYPCDKAQRFGKLVRPYNHKIKITKDEQGFYMGVDEEDERDEIEEEIRNIIGSYEEKAHSVFAPFAPDERKSPDSDDDAFVVKMPKRRVLEDDEGWIGFGEKDKVQRKKDLFDALTRRCRSAVPDKTSTTEGWIEPKRQASVAPLTTSPGWIELGSASPPRDPKPPAKDPSKQGQGQGRRSRPAPKTHKRGGSSVSSFSSTVLALVVPACSPIPPSLSVWLPPLPYLQPPSVCVSTVLLRTASRILPTRDELPPYGWDAHVVIHPYFY